MQEVISAVVIDDKISDINGISLALCQAGISSLPIHYQKDATATKNVCKKVGATSPRIIITDIQLQQSGRDPSSTDLALVASFVFEITKDLTGPYIVLAWTTRSNHVEKLSDTIEKLCKAKSANRPLFIGAIDKSDCKSDDDANVYIADKILVKFQEHLKSDKQIRALLNWEKGVMSAAHRAVNSIISVPNGTLASTLYQLGIQSVGKDNLNGHESTAINNAISNILYDELGQESLNTYSKDIWKDALDVNAPKVSEEAKHQLNSILHFDMLPKEDIVFPGDVFICQDLVPFFSKFTNTSECGKQLKQFIDNLIPRDEKQLRSIRDKVKSATNAEGKKSANKKFREKYEKPRLIIRDQSHFVFLEISPACDFSNNKRQLKPFALGLITPSKAIDGVFKATPTTDVLRCKIKWNDIDYTLMVSAKYQIQLSEQYVMKAAEDNLFTNRFRMRDSLLQSWVQSIAQYNSRIGTISFQ